MSAPAWCEKYVGIRYADGGRDESACDCWGLVRLVFARERGIVLPTYGEISAENLLATARVMAKDFFAEPWLPAPTPRAFDVALMSAPGCVGRGAHCGILVSDATVLHVWRGTDAVAMNLDHPALRHRLCGFFRHRALL